MKTLTLKNIKNIFGIPSVIIHELSHIIMSFLFFKPIKCIAFKLDLKRETLSAFIFYKRGSRGVIDCAFVSLAPLIPFVTAFILAFYHTVFIFIFIYFVITWKYILPSKMDLSNLDFIDFYHKSESSIHNEDNKDDEEEDKKTEEFYKIINEEYFKIPRGKRIISPKKAIDEITKFIEELEIEEEEERKKENEKNLI